MAKRLLAWLLVGLLCVSGAFGANVKGRNAALIGTNLPQNNTCGFPGTTVDLNFAAGCYFGVALASLTFARASTTTDLTHLSPPGYPYQSIGTGTLAVTRGVGMWSWEARTNLLLNSAAPVTQTTGSLANGTYVLWVNGTGSAQMSAGTATGCGTSTATNYNFITFTTSGAAGTCTVTVTGSLNAFQLELGPFPTALIVTAGTTVARAADQLSWTPSGGTIASAISLMAYGVPYSNGAANQSLISIDDGSSANRISIARNTSEQMISINSAGPNPGIAVTWNRYTPGKLASSVITANGGIIFNAMNLVTVTTAGTPGAMTIMHFGDNATGGNQWNGSIARIMVWPSSNVPYSTIEAVTKTPQN